MADTIVTIKTWACPNCEYKQYHDPSNEVEMNDIFSEPRYAGRPLGACPACYAGENAQRTKQLSYLESISGSDLSALGQKNVADDATLEERRIPDMDENGQPIMEETGETRYQFNPLTGQIDPVAVTAPKMRPLTDDELAALKLQRNQNLDALSSIAVSEVSQEAGPEAA
jgi:hypothetical protein